MLCQVVHSDRLSGSAFMYATSAFLCAFITPFIIGEENRENSFFISDIALSHKKCHNGDKVLVEKCDSVDVGEIGIFVVNGEVFIKERGNGCLISHNEKYKPIRLTENDSVFCCGRVVGRV